MRNGSESTGTPSPAPPGERLQKILARAGIASRRGGEDLIRQGRVTVNGEVAELGQRVTESDSVKVDGRRINSQLEKRYLLLNKPRGTITTRSDPEGRKTVLDLVPARLRRGLFPVGRLDYHTEGLLILTTDGDFAHKVSHPSHGCAKLYEAKVRGVPSAEAIEKLRNGIVLHKKRTAPCSISRMSLRSGPRAESTNSWWRVELRQGLTRQIRDMFQRIGHPVQRLRRTAIGGVRDPRLGVGEMRELRPAEVARLLERSSETKAVRSSAAQGRAAQSKRTESKAARGQSPRKRSRAASSPDRPPRRGKGRKKT